MNIPDSDESSNKPYRLSFEHRPQYLYAYVTGEDDNYEISRQYWREIADECKRNGYIRVLVEEDIPVNGSLTEVYQFASELPQLGFFGIRVAFVDRYIEQQELNKFGETVATNRGLVGRIFNHAAEAEKWLLSD